MTDDDLTIDGSDLMARVLAEQAGDADTLVPGADRDATLDPTGPPVLAEADEPDPATVAERRPGSATSTRSEHWRPASNGPTEVHPVGPVGYGLPVVIGAFAGGSLLGSLLMVLLR